MREMSPFSPRRSEVSIELCSWTMNTVQHRQEPARPLTDRIDYALMRVSPCSLRGKASVHLLRGRDHFMQRLT